MKRVLIAVLDWGLGHATRCIPIVNALLARNCKVLIAGSGSALALLKAEFSSLPFFELSPYSPEYPAIGSMVWKMASQLPKFMQTIKTEHQQLEQIIKEQGVDLVIADNRYGCWSELVPSVFITHQSNILMPHRFGWLSPLVRFVNERQMEKFTHWWIPDNPGRDGLTGHLSGFSKRRRRGAIDYIGNLSRFTRQVSPVLKYDVVAVCSGPEPKRTHLEQLFTRQLQPTGLRFLIVRGVVSESGYCGDGMVNYLTTDALQEILSSAKLVIARSGYSTIMDMLALGKKFVGIPTPGQTEQEYLAYRLKTAGIAFFMHERDFDLVKAMEESKKYKGFSSFEWRNGRLDAAINKLLAL